MACWVLFFFLFQVLVLSASNPPMQLWNMEGLEGKEGGRERLLIDRKSAEQTNCSGSVDPFSK